MIGCYSFTVRSLGVLLTCLKLRIWTRLLGRDPERLGCDRYSVRLKVVLVVGICLVVFFVMILRLKASVTVILSISGVRYGCTVLS